MQEKHNYLLLLDDTPIDRMYSTEEAAYWEIVSYPGRAGMWESYELVNEDTHETVLRVNNY